jgi:hypothetical protein
MTFHQHPEIKHEIQTNHLTAIDIWEIAAEKGLDFYL